MFEMSCSKFQTDQPNINQAAAVRMFVYIFVYVSAVCLHFYSCFDILSENDIEISDSKFWPDWPTRGWVVGKFIVCLRFCLHF